MIQIEKLSYGVPAKELYENISFSLEAGSHYALIGSNGCGKSTLVDMIMHPDEYLFDGKIIRQDECRIGYASQFNIREKTRECTVFEYLSEYFVNSQKEIEKACEEMAVAEDMEAAFEKYQKLMDIHEAMDADNYESNIKKELNVAGLGDLANTQVSQISGGEYKLVQIMREMLLAPNLLILDEPDVFLDFANLSSLSSLINDYKGTLLVVTHNRFLLNHCFDRILHLEDAQLQEFEGGYMEYRCSLLEEKLRLRIQNLQEQEEIARTQEMVDILRKRATLMVNPVIGQSVNAKQSQLDRLKARQIKPPFIEDREPAIRFPEVEAAGLSAPSEPDSDEVIGTAAQANTAAPGATAEVQSGVGAPSEPDSDEVIGIAAQANTAAPGISAEVQSGAGAQDSFTALGNPDIDAEISTSGTADSRIQACPAADAQDAGPAEQAELAGSGATAEISNSGAGSAAAQTVACEAQDVTGRVCRAPQITDASRLGETQDESPVLKVENYSIAFDESLLENVSFHIQPGEKVAVVGANGTGKTTLVRDILKNDNPAIKLGEGVKFACMSQLQGDAETEEKTVYELLYNAGLATRAEMNGQLANYCLGDDYLDRRIRQLSGGEQNLLQLALLELSGAELLILDEPSSHLDIYAQAALERALAEYKGSVLMVSHDFYLVANCVDYVLMVEDNTIRRMRNRNFRKLVYDKYFSSEYLQSDRQKQEIEAAITAAFKKDNLASVEKLCAKLAEM
mgnify:CR=1 FL=1